MLFAHTVRTMKQVDPYERANQTNQSTGKTCHACVITADEQTDRQNNQWTDGRTMTDRNKRRLWFASVYGPVNTNEGNAK